MSILTILWVASSQARPNAADELQLGRPKHVQVVGAHVFCWRAATGQYFRILLEPEGSPLRARLVAPSGSEVATVGNSVSDQRALPLSGVSAESGEYQLRVEPTDPEVPEITYQIALVDLRAPQRDDSARTLAERTTEAGKELVRQGGPESLAQGIEKLQSALPLWRGLSDKTDEGRTLDAIGDAWWAQNQPAKASDFFAQALAVSKAAGDPSGEASALSNQGISVSFREPRKALEYFEASLKLSRAANDKGLEATTLGNVGSVYMLIGDPRKALENASRALELRRAGHDHKGALLMLANVGTAKAALGDIHPAIEAFEEVLAARRKLHDQRGEAYALHYLGWCYTQLGEPDRALTLFRECLPLMRAAGDQRGEARTLSNMAVAEFALGTPQDALHTLQGALPLSHQLKDRHLEESVLNNMAHAYLMLGAIPSALDFGTQALEIQRQLTDKKGEASTLRLLGSIHAYQGDSQKALDTYQQALPIVRAAGDRAAESDLLGDIASALLKRGDPRAALPDCERALALAKEIDDRHRQGIALINLGAAHVALEDWPRASDCLRDGLTLIQASGDRLQQGKALASMARLDEGRRDWAQARVHLKNALRIDEEARAAIVGWELRSSYFATVLDQYELLVDVLMHLNADQPGHGFDAEAFEVSEGARARSLLDLLGAVGATGHQGAGRVLFDRERVLVAQLHSKTERQIQLLSKKDETRAAEVEAEIRALTTQYRDLKATVLAATPRYAEFADSKPLSLPEIQSQLLDADTVLLEYASGPDRSFVWAVTPTTFKAYELPKRSVLEGLARRAYTGMSARDATPDSNKARRELSAALIGPVATELGTKRLLIVTDGALQFVPFAALAAPAHADEPLIVSHEIVSLPSASTLAFIRRQASKRARPAKSVAVIADPVFSADDPRLRSVRSSAPTPVRMLDAERSASGFGRATFSRLPSTRREALDILSLVSKGTSLSALDFDANRRLVTSEALSAYRFVHIASHGLLNSLHPELSAVVLSLVNAEGEVQDGFLQTTDVYDLKLNADLVVLSACETALGEEVRGEGLVGLTRAFMYAGAQGVVASLWTVPDVSTAELMTRFYQAMLVKNLRPAAALRQAQISIWKERRWARPYFWAAFTLQGEWK